MSTTKFSKVKYTLSLATLAGIAIFAPASYAATLESSTVLGDILQQANLSLDISNQSQATSPQSLSAEDVDNVAESESSVTLQESPSSLEALEMPLTVAKHEGNGVCG